MALDNEKPFEINFTSKVFLKNLQYSFLLDEENYDL